MIRRYGEERWGRSPCCDRQPPERELAGRRRRYWWDRIRLSCLLRYRRSRVWPDEPSMRPTLPQPSCPGPAEDRVWRLRDEEESFCRPVRYNLLRALRYLPWAVTAAALEPLDSRRRESSDPRRIVSSRRFHPDAGQL